MYRTKHLYLFLCMLFVVGSVGSLLYIIPYGVGDGKNQSSTNVVFAVPQERYALYTKPENASVGARAAFISKVRDTLDSDMPKKNISDTEIAVIKDEPVQVFETTPVIVSEASLPVVEIPQSNPVPEESQENVSIATTTGTTTMKIDSVTTTTVQIVE